MSCKKYALLILLKTFANTECQRRLQLLYNKHSADTTGLRQSTLPVSELASGSCADVGTEHSKVLPFKEDGILTLLTEQP